MSPLPFWPGAQESGRSGSTDHRVAEDEIARAFDDVIFSGYLTPFSAAGGVADEERKAEDLSSVAGLGCANEVQQRQALAEFLTVTQTKLKDMSIKIPNYSSYESVK